MNKENEQSIVSEIELNVPISLEDARELYARLVRSRDGLRQAIADDEPGNIGYFFGWLDADLTTLAALMPATLGKKALKQAAGKTDVVIHGGGGAKPN